MKLLIAKIVLITWGLLATNHEGWSRLASLMDSRLYFPVAVVVGIWITALVAIFYVAFSPFKIMRVLWTVLIGLSALAGETYFLVVGDRITIEALDAMWDPGLFSFELAAFYGSYILRALANTSLLVAGLLIPPPPLGFLSFRKLKLLPLAPCFLLGGLIYYVGASIGFETKGMPSQFYNLSLFTVFHLTEAPPAEKSEPNMTQTSSPLVRHVVLIVDESVSGDFIDLNVPRGTTPFLASRTDSITNFGLAISASNCTHASNAILRLGANPKTLTHDGNSILSNPSIWKYARKAGFETHFIEAPVISMYNGNHMNPQELKLIDQVHSIPRENARAYRDLEIIGILKDILQRNRPQFVYVNKIGAHFPYQNSYPENADYFKPHMTAHESIGSRERLVNSYKNSIRWAVDGFFEILSSEIDLSESVLIYTSDHGQNLLDDDQPVTHCRRMSQNLHEAVVPLLVWSGNDTLHGKFDLAASHNFNSASHFEIFPTILTLFGYDPQSIRKQYHQSLFETIDEPLGFVSGPIAGRFGRKATWNSREGLEIIKR
jgi:glucan phosphoethanolaminetransferase (alkaline phosphatase superfamily)